MSHPFEIFGKYLFTDATMKERLPHPIYKRWKTSLTHEAQLDSKTADAIAHAMKTWALELGATHYSHWFQPMTGKTAEKHDAFLEPGDDGEPLARFSGKSLIKGETDGSSFPNGGLRATFEARGYTYWDISSPAFIRNHVLCIPTIFISFNGDSLDKKAPLLKSMDALSKQSTRLLQLLGEKDVTSVTPVLGQEQEYFLVDQKHYQKRLDLKLTGRTLLGKSPAKGQEAEEHYFGSIPQRVASFMQEVNLELWKLGIYSRVEHNEVAYGQFEIVPIYAPAHIAIDQNQLIMDILKQTAPKHGLACLLHEKPFANINGSGKHNNWSLVDNLGNNMLDPSENPQDNLRFLLFVCALMKGIDQYPELLRMASSGAGNDHRLGANEAPPAIISMYVGSDLERLLYFIESGDVKDWTNGNTMHSPLNNLKALPKEASDRNRTSPFAFTGNKFEFRMVGSSRSAATTNIVLNTLLADALAYISDEIESSTLTDLKANALNVCQKIIAKHKRILFSGDGYSENWLIEAKRRGLPNLTSFAESIDSLIEPKSVKLFERHGVFNHKELEARAEIMHEQFIRSITFEAKALLQMVRTQILPSSVKEVTLHLPLRAAGIAYSVDMVEKFSTWLSQTNHEVNELEKMLNRANLIANLRERSLFMHQVIRPQLNCIRDIVDSMEGYMSKENYPIPTYTELLFQLDD